MSPIALMMADQLTGFLIVYARVGTALIMMPGIGGSMIPPRVKVIFSMLVCFIALPATGAATVAPEQPSMLVALLAIEVTVGFFFALAMRAILSAIHIFGAKFGFYSGLSNALAPNDGISEGGSSVATMIQLGTLAVIMLTNTHHILIYGVIRSYAAIPLGTPMLSDMAQQLARLSANAFWIAMMMGAPFMIYSLLSNLALGLANKVMPSMQVFFVAGPALIVVGFAILALTFPSMIELVRGDLADWAILPVR